MSRAGQVGRDVERDEREFDVLDRAAVDLRMYGEPHEGDDALLARSVQGALTRVRRRQEGDGATLRYKRRAARVLLLAAALLLVATAAAIAMLQSRRSFTHPAPSQTADDLQQATPVIVEPQPSADETASSVPATAAPTQGPPSMPAAVSTATAAELFGQANEARRSGQTATAVRKYRELEQRFAGSAEASMSRVMLGRLYLDRLGDAASALAQFEAYLRAGAESALREEAFVGRALALQRLGRNAEEKRAWQALLAAYPGSLSADRARSRLAELP